MNYLNYQNARDASWELLIDLNIGELPIQITVILKKLGIPLHKYGENKEFISRHNLDGIAQTSDGFTILVCGKHHIFYDEDKSINRKRFTLAHELGHIICDHLFEIRGNISLTTRNNEPNYSDSLEEQQANIFAIRLLAPSCVLHELELFTADQIADACQISIQSAEFRLARLLELEQRNNEYLKSKGYGCYYMHPLERKVKKRFEEFLQRNKL